MSIFSAIKNAIFGGPAQAEEAPRPAAGAPASAPASAPAAGAPSPASASKPAAAPTASAAPAAKVDVAKVLDAIKTDEKDIDWRKSIVDLMKLLKIDSSFKARKQLAKELGYTGDTGDSATMNVWLHKQVMTKLAEHGGIVPPELKH